MFVIRVIGFSTPLITEDYVLAEETAAALAKQLNCDTEVWGTGTLVHEFFAESKP
jgi:hypothetical protein